MKNMTLSFFSSSSILGVLILIDVEMTKGGFEKQDV